MAKILYFSTLVDKVEFPSEKAASPGPVSDVCALLSWLRTRGPVWEQALREDAVRITVNRKFAEAGTAVNDKMGIAFVPMRAE